MKYFYTSLLLSLLFACMANSSESTTSLPNKVVLIFSNYPDSLNIRTSPTSGTIQIPYDICFRNDELVNEQLVLKKVNCCSDTIVINTKRRNVELIHTYNVFEQASYLLRNGDTAVFTYKDNVPHIAIVNRVANDYDGNFSINSRKDIYGSQPSAAIKYRVPFFFKDNAHENESIAMLRQRFAAEAKQQYINLITYIDSLYSNGKLSKELYKYHRYNHVSRVYSATCKEEYFKDPKFDNLLKDTLHFNLNNDTLLYYSYFTNFLNSKIRPYINSIEMIKTENSILPDYCARFDTISKLDFLTCKAKRYFLREELEKIVEEGNAKSIESYLSKYATLTLDTATVSLLKNEYNLDFSNSGVLQLEGLNGDSLSFQDLLNKCMGKIVYVDFWASWCAPCKQSMPYAKKLREEYKEKNIVFVYLAFNDTKKAWINAIEKLEIDGTSENYFIINPKTSKFIERYNIRSIPRYMLFGKNGEMLNQNAPRPEDSNIRELLDDYLRK